ncbi:MAG TPA: IS21-like element helper ATPase IstB [Polyangium sp.]|nr:IS21-like element helper ATPase IstB [Polyangium sp.]
MVKRIAGGSIDPPVGDDLVVTRIQQHLQFLGMTHTREKLDELLAYALRERPSHTVWLEHVLGAEVGQKLESRIARRVDTSGLRERKTLEAFDFNFQPKLDKAFVLEMGRLDFARRHDDLVITGKSGTGKSHLLKAFGLRACQQQISMRYARCVDLLDDLYAGLADNTYTRRLHAWARPELLIIDDVGLGQVKKRENEPTAAHMLFNLIDRRHGRCSTAVSSNIALSEWGKYLGDATIAMAILDRLVMHALRIEIDGPSYRQHVAEQRSKKRSPAKAEPSATADKPSA